MNDLNLPYRPNVCVIVLNQENLIFVGERISQPGAWQLPQGGREQDSVLDAALREASEELGVSVDLLEPLIQLETEHYYDFIAPPEFAIGRWRGQHQNFVVLRFLGSEADIDLNRHLPAEFSDYRWCPLVDIPVIVEQRRLTGYLKAFRELQQAIDLGGYI